jgi:ADP-heptose:LPS heptosyltransferase
MRLIRLISIKLKTRLYIKILSFFKNKLFRVIDNIIDTVCRFNNSAKFKADLLLIRVDAIGDFILWQDSLRAYHKKYKGQKVILLCNNLVYDIALLDNFFFDIWSIDKSKFNRSPMYRYQLVKKIKSYYFKEVISPVYSRDYYFSDRLVYLTLSDNKIGYNGNLSNIKKQHKKKSDKWYTRLVDYNEKDSSELLINANFVKCVCDSNFVPHLPVFFFDTKDYHFIYEKYCVFSISASYAPRAWNATNFSIVANKIPLDYQIVLLGKGNVDRKKGDEFIANISNKERIHNLINKTSIVETIKIVSRATFVIGNDSSVVHIAGAVRVPSICLASGAHYKRFMPYPAQIPEYFYHPRTVVHKMDCFGCDYRCIYPIIGQLECIKGVEVSEVILKLHQLLDELKEKEL